MNAVADITRAAYAEDRARMSDGVKELLSAVSIHSADRRHDCA